MTMIKIKIEERNNEIRELEIPSDINLSLMEVLKAAEYNILATCGGIALCATCRIEIIEGAENLPPAMGLELDMLDTLPDCTGQTRLACQLRLSSAMDGLVLRISPGR